MKNYGKSQKRLESRWNANLSGPNISQRAIIYTFEHYQLVTMEPVSVSASRWHVYRLTPPNKTVSNADLERSRKDVAFVKDAGFEENREAACSIKRGLMGGGNTHFTFGRFEKEIVHFHRQLSVPINQLSN